MAAMEAVPRMPMIWLDLKEAGDFQFGTSVKQFILKNYGEDPDNYNEQLKKLLQLRQSAVNVTRDFEGCSTLRKYFGQLHYLQSRVPMGPGQEAAVPVSWTEIFSGKTVSHDDISYEQACILYNLGALHSMLGAMDNRVSEEGMKVSCTHFQCSAGAFSYLRDHYSHNYSVDMSHQILNLNINLMLGQAQECLLEKSMLDNRKSFLVARISAQVVDYYKEACRALDNSETASMLGKIQKDWKKLVQMKIYYFAAIAHLHMGKQAEEQQKYGERLAYLQSSLDKLSEAMKLAKGQPDSVQEALRFSMDVIGGKFNSAKKDNDFIYHETVPALDTLPSVKGAPLVKALPVNPTDPTVTGPDIFCKLVPMAAHEASSLYSEEKAKLLRETMAKIDDKNETLEQFMDSLSLDPDAIDNMDMYSTIPPVVMEKCAALSVRPDTVKSLIQSMQALSGVFTDVEASLREIRDVLDKDEAADRSLQEAAGKQAVPPVPASLVELRRDLEKYVEYQEKASFTNTELHRAMNLHISQLRLLGGPLDSLKDALPRPELSEEDEAALAGVKRMLGKVQEMREQRGSLEKQLRDLIQQDDITSALVTTERSDMKRVFEEQLLKYEQVKLYIEQNLAAQDNILKALTDANVQSAAARKTLSDTQHKWNSTVQTLVASYEAYEDLMKKSQEGKEFYEDLEAKVSKLLEKAKALCQSREEERQAVMERELQKKAPPQRPTAPKPPAKKPVDIDPNTIDDPELAELTAAILALGGDLPEELRSMPPEFALPHSALPAAAAAPGPLPGQVPGPGAGPGSAVHWPGPYAPPPMRFPPNLPSPELLARISAGFPQSLPPGAPLPHHQMPPQQLPQYPPPHPNAQAPPGSQPPPPPATAAAYTPRPSHSQPAPPPPVAPGPAPTPAPTQVRPSTTTVDSVQTPIASYSAPSPGQPHPQHQPQPQPQHHSQHQPQHQVPAPQRHPVPVSTGYAPAPQMGPYAHYMPQGVPSQQQQQQQPPPQPQHFPHVPPTPHPVAPPQTAHFQPIPAQQMGPRPVPGPGHQLPVAPPQGQYQQYMPQQRHPAAPPPNFLHAPLPPGQVPAPGMQPGVPHPHAHQHARQQGYPPVSMVPGGHPSQVVPVSGVAQNHMPYLPHASQPMPPPASQPYMQQQQPQPQMQHPPPHMPMPHHMHHVAPGAQQRMPPPPQMAPQPQPQPQPPTSQPQMPPPGSAHPHMLPVSKQLSPPSLSQIPPAGHPPSAHPSQVQLHAPQPLHPAMYQQTQHLPQAPRGPQVHMPPTSMPSQHMPPTSSMPPQQMPPTSMPGQHMPPTSMPSQPFMHPNANGLPPQRHPQPPGPQSHPQMPPQGHMAQQPMPVPPHQPVPPHAHAHTGQVPAGYPGAGYVMRQPGPSVVPPQQQPQPQQQPPPPLTPQPMAPQQQHPPPPPPQPLAPQQMPPQPPSVSFTPTPPPAGMPPGLGQQQHPGAGAPAPGQAPQNIMTPTTGPVGAGPVAPSVLPSPAPSPSPSPGPSSLVMTPPQHPCPSPALTPGAVAPAPHPPPPPAPSSNSSSSSASSSSSSSSSSVPPPAAPPAPGDALFQRQNSSTDDLLSSSPESQHGGTKDNVLLPTKADPEEDGQRRKKSEGVRLIQGDPYQAPERVARLCTQLERFRNTVQSLEQPSSSGAGSEGGGVLSRLDGQWKELAERQEKEARQLSIAIARCYTMKNRHQDVMPYDRNRVVLRSGKDDYINASFIEELSPYCPRLIATQAPLTGTAADFWLMVYEQKVSVVVMLVSEQELEKQKVPHYFPSERGQQLSQGPITLTLTTQKTTPTHVERMISLQYRDQSLKRTVIHLQYTSWPELGLPDSKSSLIRFIQEVHGHYLHQRPLHTPIVVHCSSGVGRTGALCLLYAALQEVEAGNGIPDLTLLVRKMRQQRKNMLQEKLHLKFCYEALLKHAEQVLQRHGVATVPCSKTLNNATIKPYSRQECQTDIVLGGDLPISSIQATIAKLSIRPQSTSDSEGSLDLGPPSTATPDLPHQQEAPEGTTTAHDPAPPQDPFPPSEAQPSSFSPPPPSISSSSSSPAKDLRSPSPPTNQGNGLMESKSEYPNHSAPALDAPVTETGTGTVSPPTLPAASASTLSSLDLLASMTPEAFTLDAACRGKQRFNKQSFLQPQEGQGLQGAPQGDDPLSNLDPLWTLNKT